MKLFFAIAASALFFSSCKQSQDCADACDPINPEITFVIKNNLDKNLVSGPDKIYTSDRIKIRSNDLISIPFYFNAFDSTSASTGLFFVAGSSDKYYLYIDNVATDSMQVTYQSDNPSRKACCPSYKSITNLLLNTVPTTYVFPDNTSVVTIIK